MNFQVWWVSLLTDDKPEEDDWVLHWISTLKRPGVKNIAEQWCVAISSLLSDVIKVLRVWVVDRHAQK